MNLVPDYPPRARGGTQAHRLSSSRAIPTQAHRGLVPDCPSARVRTRAQAHPSAPRPLFRRDIGECGNDARGSAGAFVLTFCSLSAPDSPWSAQPCGVDT